MPSQLVQHILQCSGRANTPLPIIRGGKYNGQLLLGQHLSDSSRASFMRQIRAGFKLRHRRPTANLAAGCLTGARMLGTAQMLHRRTRTHCPQQVGPGFVWGPLLMSVLMPQSCKDFAVITLAQNPCDAASAALHRLLTAPSGVRVLAHHIPLPAATQAAASCG